MKMSYPLCFKSLTGEKTKRVYKRTETLSDARCFV